MPLYEGTYVAEIYLRCSADDKEQAEEFIKEMGMAEFDNANLMYVKDIVEVKN